uniref:Uncharacterized protein n=1 Tax=Nothobranchius furzeri TaxID=105023 RepID=A0A1A8B8R5_NOTFU
MLLSPWRDFNLHVWSEACDLPVKHSSSQPQPNQMNVNKCGNLAVKHTLLLKKFQLKQEIKTTRRSRTLRYTAEAGGQRSQKPSRTVNATREENSRWSKKKHINLQSPLKVSAESGILAGSPRVG